jgi:thiol-disulfide isomerase/thioredoxin
MKIVILLMPDFFASAQVNTGPYSIGDEFPNYTFNVVTADSSYQFTIDSYKGKAVIIDLWDIHCSGCISGLKTLDSLQKLFPDKIKIILVTKNSGEQVEKLFSKKTITRPDLLSVVSDTALYDSFFPHDGDPLNVWIDDTGIIRYITGGYNTTFNNISRFLNNERLNVAHQTKLKDFNSASPLIEEAATRLKFYTAAYSLFTIGIQDIVNTNYIEALNDKITGKPYSLKALNASRFVLYQLAFNKELYGFDLNMFQLQKNNRVILNSRRADSLETPKEIEYLDNWKSKNSYCYELFLPPENSTDFYKWMQQDLQRFFKLEASVQLIKANCFVLSETKNRIRNNRSPKERMFNQNNFNKSVFNDKRKEMEIFMKELIYLTQDFNLPIVNEMNRPTKLSIKLPSQINSIKELNDILSKYGLSLSREVRKIEFLIIK